MEMYLNLELGNLVVGGEVEQWKQVCEIDGLENVCDWYYVSSFGRVKSVKGRFSDKILKQEIVGKGYLRVGLSTTDSKRKRMRVNRLVALAFVDGHSAERNQSNHINEIKTDNRASNLNWMSAKENANFGNRNKKIAEGQSKPVVGIHIETGKVIEFPSTKEASQNGFHSSALSYCCNGKRKTHKGYRWSYVESA